MIVQGRLHHKHRPPVSGPVVLGVLLLLAGCGGGDKTAEQRPTTAPLPCPVTVEVSGWQEFLALAGRVESGQPVERTDLEALATLPAYTTWSASFPVAGRPTPIRIANWLERTFAEELGVPSRRKVNIDLRTLSRSFRWSLDQRELVDQRLDALADGPWCALDKNLRRWIPASTMPDTVRIHVLPARPELRFFEDQVFVDTGVLAAGTNRQLVGQITGLVYRNLAIIDGPNPLEESGASAIANLFRVITNEGVAIWLEDLPHTSFHPDHPSLRKVRPIPEDYWEGAIRVLTSLDRHLPSVLDDPDARHDATAEIVGGAVGGGLPGQGSWCMATTIAEALGEERLHAVAHSVPAFVTAYQEAASRNAQPLPAMGDVTGAYHTAMPPFSAATWDRLLPLLERHFPASTDEGN